MITLTRNIFLIFLCLSTGAQGIEKDSLKLQMLGKKLYFDTNLSKNRSQSCASCHNPDFGFVDPRTNISGRAASLGDDGKSLGDRNAPTAAYASFSPKFYQDGKTGEYFGGQFHDGREADLEGQAGGPPLNPIEMGMVSKKEVAERIKENKSYEKQFKALFGAKVFNKPDLVYQGMARAIASFERSAEFAPFDSKYDRELRGDYEFTELEELGKALFFSNNNTNCSSCHMLHSESHQKETFSNYSYHNIHVPQNLALRKLNKVQGADKGLLNNPKVIDKRQAGKFKTPTLRNIAVTGPYMHNGVFQELRTVILFYDKFNNKKRTLNPETQKPWREGPFPETVSRKDLNAKVLSDRKVDALLAFLETLTDKRYEHLLEKKK